MRLHTLPHRSLESLNAASCSLDSFPVYDGLASNDTLRKRLRHLDGSLNVIDNSASECLGAFLSSTLKLEGLAICGTSLSTTCLELLLNGIFINPCEKLRLGKDIRMDGWVSG